MSAVLHRICSSEAGRSGVDAIPAVAIPDVVACYRDLDEGASVLVRLEDLADYPALVAQGPLGWLATTGTLDRFLKRKVSSPDREAQRRALMKIVKQAHGA